MEAMNEELLELLKKYAYKKGEFTLSSGKTSEHYLNCKMLLYIYFSMCVVLRLRKAFRLSWNFTQRAMLIQ